MTEEYCQRCERPLHDQRIVWLILELSGYYYDPEDPDLPFDAGDAGFEVDHQGCFPFGPACAAKELARTRQHQKAAEDKEN